MRKKQGDVCATMRTASSLMSTQYMLPITIIVIKILLITLIKFINTYNVLQNMLDTVPAPQNHGLTYISTKLMRIHHYWILPY